jgi:hypothetical protein
MTKIKWGREIPVNGMRPEWLRDDELISANACVTGHVCNMHWANITDVQLPADHPAYLAMDKGLEPWGGMSNDAPEDWDSPLVLWRDDSVHRQLDVAPWKWGSKPYLSDIIGYPRRKPVQQLGENLGSFDPDTVSIKRMTVDEARERFDIEPAGIAMKAFRSLGLIREETLAERFTRETGHEATPAVLAALEWSKDHGE